MERPVTIVDAAVARAAIARLYLGSERAPSVVGTITLRPHQRVAVDRLRGVMAEFGGALLADEVGLGKSYVAAALAREAYAPLVVAPAALRSMWSAALEATGVRAPVVSYEALSRGRRPAGTHDFLVLDEAHHVRTPGTRRYREVAELASRGRILLMSATPIHNTRRDLAALLALFLGARAWSLDESALARCVVRRERCDIAGGVELPQASEPRWLHVGSDEALLEEILALPPPLPPSDCGDAGALVAYSLARQWASSHGALYGALRRRLARAIALIASLERGRYPSRVELSAWSLTDDSLQLAFPELLVPPSPAAASLLAGVRTHERALGALLRRVERSSGIDKVRAERLRQLRAAHPGEKIIAFTQFADTVSALFRYLRHDRGVAALSARGAVVAGGWLSRDEAIRRFAPIASGVGPPREIDRIDLLLTTDLLSEGVNLQDASVVVHLELPWTPARLDQRVGRSRRLGARHARTTVYAMAPPAGAEVLLRVEARLRDKIRAAERLVGLGGVVLPTLAGPLERAPMESAATEGSTLDGATVECTVAGAAVEASAARRIQLLRNALLGWRGSGLNRGSPARPSGERPAVEAQPSDPERDPPSLSILAAAIRAPRTGLIALLCEDGRALLLAGFHEALTDDVAAVLEVVAHAEAADAPLDGDTLTGALETVSRWIARRQAARVAGDSLTVACPARRAALRRIAAITASSPHHRRPALAALAIAARQAVIAHYGAGAERALGELVEGSIPDEAWLRAVVAFGAAHARPDDGDSRSAQLELRALLVLVRG